MVNPLRAAWPSFAMATNRPTAVFILACLLSLQGCATVPTRNPIPEHLSNEASIPGIPQARHWGDDRNVYDERVFALSERQVRERFPDLIDEQHSYLAISGGGSRGAFGAGLLAGWSEAGTRPEFALVSGISAGALIAPFAFLGPRYDGRLKEMYTSHSSKDIYKLPPIFSILGRDSLVSTKPFLDLIKHYFNEEMIQEIAAEFKRGRRLFIGTTNLDAGRSVIWNIGSIAASGVPGSVELIQKVILASASIPGAFSPVYFKVEADGKEYDEMHVDGGATTQISLYPAGVEWRRVLEKFQATGAATVYLIRNAQLGAEWESVRPRLLPIARRTMDSLIRTQGNGDIYRMYFTARRDGLNFRLAYIPDDLDLVSSEVFDPVYMGKLYKLGYELAKQKKFWKSSPPGVRYRTGHNPATP